MVHSLCFMCWPILDPIFSLHLGQPCIFSCSIKIYWDTQRTLHLIACSKSWSIIAQLMSLSWCRLRAISWILLLISTLKILILHGLSHKLEHGLFESSTQELQLHFFFLIISYSSLQIDDLDANTQGIYFIFMASILESNTWSSSNAHGIFLHIKLNENITP